MTLSLIITTAGLARYAAGQGQNGGSLTVTAIGFTASTFVVAPSLTALPGEHRRLTTIAGGAVGDNVVHLVATDATTDSYDVRGFGLYLADGTLFAVYGQADLLVGKSAQATLLLPLDIAFPSGDVTAIRFGDTNFLNPPATTEMKGVVELATLTEADAGDTTRVTTGAIVKTMIANALAMVTQALKGLEGRTVYGSGLVKGGGDATTNRTLTVDAASAADVLAGLRGDMAITPAGLAALAATIQSTGEFYIAPGVLAKVGLQTGPFGEGPVAINFPTPFPNTCLFAIGIAVNTAGDIRCDSYVQERFLTAATFTAFVQKQASDSTNIDAIRWFAIGR